MLVFGCFFVSLDIHLFKTLFLLFCLLFSRCRVQVVGDVLNCLQFYKYVLYTWLIEIRNLVDTLVIVYVRHNVVDKLYRYELRKSIDVHESLFFAFHLHLSKFAFPFYLHFKYLFIKN